jgi:hypothetical protein
MDGNNTIPIRQHRDQRVLVICSCHDHDCL